MSRGLVGVPSAVGASACRDARVSVYVHHRRSVQGKALLPPINLVNGLLGNYQASQLNYYYLLDNKYLFDSLLTTC